MELPISIIIPVYNTKANLLENLFKSISNAYNHFNNSTTIEIILIDDGSECEETIKYLNAFSKNSESIKLIRTANKGRSNARNLGIKESSGKFLVFLDSDDEVKENYFKELLSTTKLFNTCDFISFAYQINKLDVYRTKSVWTRKNTTYDEEKYFTICSSIFRKKFLDDYEVRFKTDLTYGEDIDFINQCLKNSSNSIHKNEIIFKYNFDFKSHEIEPLSKKLLRPMYFQFKYRLNSIIKTEKITSNV